MRKSKWTLNIILGELPRSWNNDKVDIYKNILKQMLRYFFDCNDVYDDEILIRLSDSLQNARVIMSLSPFSSKINSNAPKGLLGLIHEIHNQVIICFTINHRPFLLE
jgi:hypothetical protein